MVDQLLPEVIAIVGSRAPSEGRSSGWTDRALVEALVRKAVRNRPNITIISGGATGVDTMVRSACIKAGFCRAEHIRIDPTSVDCPKPHFHEFPALWRGKDGRSPTVNKQAGFERNAKIVQHSQLVIALFADGEMSPGTSDTVRKARKARIPVLVYHEGKWW